MHYRSALVLAATLPALMGCRPQVHVRPVGFDYTLVWRDPMNPDDHPGTALHYKGKEIWPNIYRGYGCFTESGIIVFVGAVPEVDGYWPYAQLFAGRGGGLPIVLSERLLQQPLSFSDNAMPFEVHDLSLTNDHFRVQFEQGTNALTRDFTWSEVKAFLEEGEHSARVVQHRLANYRILP